MKEANITSVLPQAYLFSTQGSAAVINDRKFILRAEPLERNIRLLQSLYPLFFAAVAVIAFLVSYLLAQSRGMKSRSAVPGREPDRCVPAVFWESTVVCLPARFWASGLPALRHLPQGCWRPSSGLSCRLPAGSRRGHSAFKPHQCDPGTHHSGPTERKENK